MKTNKVPAVIEASKESTPMDSKSTGAVVERPSTISPREILVADSKSVAGTDLPKLESVSPETGIGCSHILFTLEFIWDESELG